MVRRVRTAWALIAACAAALAFSACGSTSQHNATTATAATTVAAVGATSSGEVPLDAVVAQVGGYVISRKMVGEWMAEQGGEDFFDAERRAEPLGLISEPANFPACLATLKTLAPKPGAGPQLTDAELMSKCEALYKGVKAQALEFVVNAFWSLNFDAAHGVTLSEKKARAALAEYRARVYPKPGEYASVLELNSRTPAQELFLLKKELIQQKVIDQVLHGGAKARATFITSAGGAMWSAHCRSGYIVEHCIGYKQPASPPQGPSLAVLFEELARWDGAKS